MTEPKILTPAEALRALADGKKLTCDVWRFSSVGFIYLDVATGKIMFKDNTKYARDFLHLYEYTEPAPKVVWVEYLCFHIKENKCIGTEWYQCDPPEPEIWTYHPTGRKIEV